MAVPDGSRLSTCFLSLLCPPAFASQPLHGLTHEKKNCDCSSFFHCLPGDVLPSQDPAVQVLTALLPSFCVRYACDPRSPAQPFVSLRHSVLTCRARSVPHSSVSLFCLDLASLRSLLFPYLILFCEPTLFYWTSVACGRPSQKRKTT